MGKIKHRLSVTLTELMVTIFIIAIFAFLVVPFYSKTVEKSRAKKAINTLSLIYSAEKRYKIDYGYYFVCTPCTAEGVYNALGININTRDFTYEIAGENPDEADQPQGFIATAQQQIKGKCEKKKMRISHSNTTVNTEECSLW